MVYLLKKAVKENHEFIADSGIFVSESSGNGYLDLLFREASGFVFSPVTHNFSYSLLKKRMIMMKNQKSQKKMPVKLLLSLLALTFALFACNSPSKPAQKATTPSKIAKTHPAQADTSIVFKVVEKMPKFPGGVKKLMNYLATHIKYPEEARTAKIQGRVFLSFIIEKDGSVSHVKVLRGIGHGCDKEAVNVVKNMPRWIPGEQRGQPVRVEFNLPVKFSLE